MCLFFHFLTLANHCPKMRASGQGPSALRVKVAAFAPACREPRTTQKPPTAAIPQPLAPVPRAAPLHLPGRLALGAARGRVGGGDQIELAHLAPPRFRTCPDARTRSDGASNADAANVVNCGLACAAWVGCCGPWVGAARGCDIGLTRLPRRTPRGHGRSRCGGRGILRGAKRRWAGRRGRHHHGRWRWLLGRVGGLGRTRGSEALALAMARTRGLDASRGAFAMRSAKLLSAPPLAIDAKAATCSTDGRTTPAQTVNRNKK